MHKAKTHSTSLKLWLLLAAAAFIPGIQGYSTGAPNGESCRTLYPGHGVDKQYGRSPYSVTAVNRYHLNDSIVVTLYSTTDTFLGFIIQSRLHSDREMLVNGQFVPMDGNAQALDCLGGYQNTLTHTNSLPKYKIEATWTPPKNFLSDIVFRATVVQSKNVFWTAIDSEPIELQSPLSSNINHPNTYNAFNEPNGHNSLDHLQHNHRQRSPYHVALSSSAKITPPSAPLGPSPPYLTMSHQPLVQDRHRNNQDPMTMSNALAMNDLFDYNICGRKLCFGLPNGCLRHRNCIMFMTASFVPYTDSVIEFEIVADHRLAQRMMNRRVNTLAVDATYSTMATPVTSSAYYSLGLSHDKLMGNDSVTDCVLENGQTKLLNSVNLENKSNEPLTASDYNSIVTIMNTTFMNGVVYCKWRKSPRFTLRGQRYDLRDNKYHLMLAYGPLQSYGNGNYRQKQPHTDKVVSDSLIDFHMTGAITAYSKAFLIKFHAFFMIVAWIGFASIGIITARYLKPLWLSNSLFGVRIWFAIHRSCMLFALILVIIGTISIILYADTFVFGLHQIFGTIAIVCMIINPIGAVFRPECESSRRWIFNWIHWFIGNIGYIGALVAAFMAYQLVQHIHLPAAYLWSLAFYIFFNLTVHSLLQLYFCNCHHSKESSDISIPSSSSMHNTSQHIDSLADTSFLRYFFILYVCVICIFVITIISFVMIN